MSLSDYFANAKGAGVLATADAKGNVDAAVYARPHVIDEETIAFIMADHMSHRNLQSNPHAVYLFMEDGDAYVGKRLYLTKVREESDPEKILADKETYRKQLWEYGLARQQKDAAYPVDEAVREADVVSGVRTR
jgi:hypothetical protein